MSGFHMPIVSRTAWDTVPIYENMSQKSQIIPGLYNTSLCLDVRYFLSRCERKQWTSTHRLSYHHDTCEVDLNSFSPEFLNSPYGMMAIKFFDVQYPATKSPPLSDNILSYLRTTQPPQPALNPESMVQQASHQAPRLP